MKNRFSDNVFSGVIFLALFIVGWIFFQYYFGRHFVIFTSEEDITATIETEFPLFAPYL